MPAQWKVPPTGPSETGEAESLNYPGGDLTSPLNTHLSAPLGQSGTLDDVNNVAIAQGFPIQPVRSVEQNFMGSAGRPARWLVQRRMFTCGLLLIRSTCPSTTAGCGSRTPGIW